MNEASQLLTKFNMSYRIKFRHRCLLPLFLPLFQKKFISEKGTIVQPRGIERGYGFLSWAGFLILIAGFDWYVVNVPVGGWESQTRPHKRRPTSATAHQTYLPLALDCVVSQCEDEIDLFDTELTEGLRVNFV